MRILIVLLFLGFSINKTFAQDTLHFKTKPIVKDASYSGGGMEDLYYYVNNNFNYNNVKKTDIPQTSKKQSYFIFYVVFAISEDGKAFEFSPKEIKEDNSFYKEAVRVIASVRWNPSLVGNEYKKQFLVLPIKASVNE
ncbi:hypothetical protein H1R17_04665 [Flavobacterium sp. xlx-214]|uniref:hypothetical protein n=1 Tax=unclassified Flavobacterium TaxID=196869 RepID=UPI0013D42D00|nr:MULTISPECIES: hypothetical protein [unclassified Flavobacterium]MBA5792186.1 hypothetical protein [Flavobacterium sp. xlx-221]QMI84430.1 hypothetical protein H1R17_04665 [Flavobacterium sp. xlx-214]